MLNCQLHPTLCCTLSSSLDPQISPSKHFSVIRSIKLQTLSRSSIFQSASPEDEHFSSAFIFASGFEFLLRKKMETSQQMALTQMRKSVQKLGFSTEKFGDMTLMRFLVARSMDVDKAGVMFFQWIKWRKSFVPTGFIDDSEVTDELEQRKLYLQGLSKSGHPVCFVRVCNHVATKDRLQFKKFVVHVLDKTIASSFTGQEVGNEKLIAILDLQGLSYKNVDARGIITGFQMLQSYYPERLAKCFLLHMPWFFVSVWRMISRFLEKATLEKIVIVTSEDEKEAFVNEVGAAVLPETCGGNAALTLLQEVKLAPFEMVTP